jgi:hypothetical protein
MRRPIAPWKGAGLEITLILNPGLSPLPGLEAIEDTSSRWILHRLISGAPPAQGNILRCANFDFVHPTICDNPVVSVHHGYHGYHRLMSTMEHSVPRSQL